MTKIQLEKIIKIADRENKPLVVMPLADYESIMATLEELSDPGALKALRQSGDDERLGKIVSFDEVFGETLYGRHEGRTNKSRRKRNKKA